MPHMHVKVENVRTIEEVMSVLGLTFDELGFELASDCAYITYVKGHEAAQVKDIVRFAEDEVIVPMDQYGQVAKLQAIEDWKRNEIAKANERSQAEHDALEFFAGLDRILS